jgi:predicted ABC-type sugar transport system permease subunit
MTDRTSERSSAAVPGPTQHADDDRSGPQSEARGPDRSLARGAEGRRRLGRLSGASAILPAIPPIWLVLIVVLIGVVWRDPSFAEPPSLMAFLKRSAPLLAVALGELFVIVAGEFDLSVGALMTACVVVSARVGEGDPSRTWWVLLLVVGLSVLVGLANGLITTVLKVPSFITTLGTMLVLNGAVFLWTGGSPTGALAENLRRYGRSGITGVPVIQQLPYAVLILVVAVAIAAFLLHRTRFGNQVYAVGGGVRAAILSGVDVRRQWQRFCSPGSPGCPRMRATAMSSKPSRPLCSAARSSVAGGGRPPARSVAPSPCKRSSRC